MNKRYFKSWSFRPIELFLIAKMAMFGVVLVWPNDSFSNPVYSSMSKLAIEEVWGVICFVLAATQFVAMIQSNKQMKIVSLCFTAFLWSFIGSMFVIVSIEQQLLNTGLTYVIDAVLTFWLAYVVGRDQ